MASEARIADASGTIQFASLYIWGRYFYDSWFLLPADKVLLGRSPLEHRRIPLLPHQCYEPPVVAAISLIF